MEPVFHVVQDLRLKTWVVHQKLPKFSDGRLAVGSHKGLEGPLYAPLEDHRACLNGATSPIRAVAIPVIDSSAFFV